MIEAIIALVMPVAVTYGSQIIKQLPVIAEASWRIPAIRGVVAVLSLVGAVLTQIAGGPEVDNMLVETTLLTVFNGVAATVIYYFMRKKLS